MDLDFIKNILRDRKPPKEIFILVKEEKFGISTYRNDDIKNFNKSYKDQMITFLEGLVSELKGVKK